MFFTVVGIFYSADINDDNRIASHLYPIPKLMSNKWCNKKQKQ